MRGPAKLITVAMVVDTAILASGELVADTQAIPDAVDETGRPALLQSITILDTDDQTASAYDIYILDRNVSMGTLNAAPSISDANSAALLGPPIAIATGDWKDLGGAKISGKEAIGKIVKPYSGRSLYAAIVNGAGTPTFASGILTVRFGFIQL
jgi:hypothetical protein